MYQDIVELFPICRSITGPGVVDTINYFKNENKNIRLERFPTGMDVFNWTIPKVWTARDAYIEHESGARFAEFKNSNLHLIGYAFPMDEEMDRDKLQEIIYTQEDQPDSIPYVTSYYKERSGFCMSENERLTLPEGQYRAFIDTTLEDGDLIVGEAIIKGEIDTEVLFSTYVCHPSMANNELSGPVLANALNNYIGETYVKPYYSYRILFLVETIGAVAYLSRHLEDLQANVAAGFVLSCVGDDRAYSHVESRRANTLADKALRAALIGKENTKTYSFLSRGSDERQFCSPGVDLPVCGYCRSKYAEYPEYHTDGDNLDLVSPEGLQGSFEVMSSIIDAFEGYRFPQTAMPCEPQLGKYGLYPTISQKGSYDTVRLRSNLIAYCDGQTDVFDICAAIGENLADVVEELKLLASHGLVIEGSEQPHRNSKRPNEGNKT